MFPYERNVVSTSRLGGKTRKHHNETFSFFFKTKDRNSKRREDGDFFAQTYRTAVGTAAATETTTTNRMI